jgi:DnaA-homolog protein
MEQLIFELAPIEPPTLANFVPGSNRELVTRLSDLVGGLRAADACVVVWGGPGSGKTHLLRACVAAAAARGRAALYRGSEDAAQPLTGVADALIAVDDVQVAAPRTQAELFTLYNQLPSLGAQLLVAAALPPARLSLRDDLRTRLAQGLVYEVVALSDADKAAAMAHFADSRGFALPGEVTEYLLARGNRDLSSLLATLTALDRFSLAQRRPITVPLAREWLARRSGLADS